MNFRINYDKLNQIIRSDYGVAAAVLIGGALGGYASTLIGPGFKSGEAQLTGWPAAFLGTLAGGIGVYVLANCNTRQLARTVFFAVVCGYSGQFVFNTAGSSLGGFFDLKKQEDKVEKDKIDIDEAVKQEGTAELKAAANDANSGALDLIGTAALATSKDKPEIAKSATDSIKNLVDSAARAAEKEPESTINLIENIGKRADARGVSEIKMAAQQAVEGILKDPDIKDKPALAQRAKAAALMLGASIPEALSSSPARAPRVHFEVPPKTTDTVLNPLKTFLSADKYTWRSTGYTGNLDTNELKVIYYDASDKAAAEKLVTDLTQTVDLPDQFQNAKTVLGKKPAGFPSGHMDLRLGKAFVTALEDKATGFARPTPSPAPAPDNP